MIIKLFPLVPHDTKIDFFGHRFYAFFASLVIIGGSILCLSIKGLNFGIDFTGGTVMEIATPVDPDMAQLREQLSGLDIGEVPIQELGNKRSLMLRFGEQPGGPDAQKDATDKIRALLDQDFGAGKVDYRRADFVGPQVGAELKMDGLKAVVMALVCIFSYIWLRFNWQYGIGAMLALIHDVVGILGLFSLTQMPFDLSTLSAILLVAGYSINETVIIFDRVRETLRKYRKMPMRDVINFSINSTLPRTIMTSGSTLLALLALWLFGGLVIRAFVSALFIGILIGTHSSYFVSTPSLYYLKLRATPEDKQN
ncbi:MAG: protein translocase subunit SecF [Rhodospirillales bacterium]|nr:protein translocase subunit SecF [Alphaproteobacteria bacterium]MCB9986012.1 protein translocase subunit SecF [Rhodospirillales bacterium]USO07413.1 MAG: protein translocase subunit SecF [Rhodospirillales bacterium]